MNFIKKLWKDESGMGIVEIAIIIVVIVAVALVFQDEITKLIESIFKQVDLSVKGIK